ncbi:hypothetical protein [Streptomyces sp. NPDC057579]|uniref:hypothetical protein n=1 Tax=Streptomyces sp. NPDC057579 TaxID=3346172 RepID=UPI00368A73CE
MATRGSTAAALDAWIVFEDEAGFSMTPPRANTWSRRGQTPVVRVRGRSWRCWSVATLAGPALAALLLQFVGATGMLTAIAGFSLLTTALAPRQFHREQAAEQPVFQGLRTGWATLRSLPTLGWLVTGLTVSNLSVGLLQAAAPVIVVNQLAHSTADVGLVWSAAAATSLMAVAVCRRAIGRWGLWPVGALSATLAASACRNLHGMNLPAWKG